MEDGGGVVAANGGLNITESFSNWFDLLLFFDWFDVDDDADENDAEADDAGRWMTGWIEPEWCYI